MPQIPNFPQDLLNQHHQWHEPGAHGSVPLRLHRMGTPGGGTEFLVFHRNFVAQALAWYNLTTFTTDPFDKPSQKASLVAPWTSVPSAMRALPEYVAFWKEAEIRLETGAPNFASEDELGFFIESGIHDGLHYLAGTVFDDKVVMSFHSPQSSLFYKIHGLVGYWWSKWQRRNLFVPDRPIPGLSRLRPSTDVFFPDQPVPGGSTQAPQPAFDPQEIANLTERVKLLESRVFSMPANLGTVTEHAPVVVDQYQAKPCPEPAT